MLNAGKELAAVLQALEVRKVTNHLWRNEYGGIKAENAKLATVLMRVGFATIDSFPIASLSN